MDHPPRVAPGTHILFLDDDAVLFNEARQELHALNTSAAVIWCLLEDGLDAAEVTAELITRLGVTVEVAAKFVTDALADWAGQGLLAGTTGQVPPPPPPGWKPRAGMPEYPAKPPIFLATRQYRLLGLVFQLRFTTAEQLALLHPVMSHLEAPAEMASTCFDVLDQAGTTLLYRDGVGQEQCDASVRMAPMVYACVWMVALRGHAFFLNIHAGVVAGPGGCVLLPAPPGSGKSTLTAALVAAGLDYFSDEVALLDAGSLRVAPFPQAFCVKQSGIDAVAPLFPGIADLPLHLRGDGKWVAYLPPPCARVPSAGQRGDIRLVVFPRYAAGAALRCEVVPKAAALGRVMEQCTVIEGGLDLAAIRRLVAWIDGIECLELVYGSTRDAVGVVIENNTIYKI